MSTLACQATTWTRDVCDGAYVTRTVEACLDYVLDGRSVRDLVAEWDDDLPDQLLTVFDLADRDKGAGVMSGTAPYDDWVENRMRIPVLLCPCGDLMCGAVTVQLTAGGDATSWSEWAWENFQDEPQSLAAAPSYVFAADHYRTALVGATELAGKLQGRIETEVRVRDPLIRWRHRGSERPQRQRRMLQRLHAEPIKPTLAGAVGSYADFLADLAAAQALVTRCCSGDAGIRRSSSGEALAILRSLRASPHLQSLPTPTQRAIAWFADELASD